MKQRYYELFAEEMKASKYFVDGMEPEDFPISYQKIGTPWEIGVFICEHAIEGNRTARKFVASTWGHIYIYCQKCDELINCDFYPDHDCFS